MPTILMSLLLAKLAAALFVASFLLRVFLVDLVVLQAVKKTINNNIPKPPTTTDWLIFWVIEWKYFIQNYV